MTKFEKTGQQILFFWQKPFADLINDTLEEHRELLILLDQLVRKYMLSLDDPAHEQLIEAEKGFRQELETIILNQFPDEKNHKGKSFHQLLSKIKKEVKKLEPDLRIIQHRDLFDSSKTHKLSAKAIRKLKSIVCTLFKVYILAINLIRRLFRLKPVQLSSWHRKVPLRNIARFHLFSNLAESHFLPFNQLHEKISGNIKTLIDLEIKMEEQIQEASTKDEDTPVPQTAKEDLSSEKGQADQSGIQIYFTRLVDKLEQLKEELPDFENELTRHH